jgi:hypothetical protein
MKNTTWSVTVLTESNYIKTVQVKDCITRKDAEAAALGMTGAKKVFNSTPVSIYQETYDDTDKNNQYQEVNNYSRIDDYYEEDDGQETLDKREEEMYDLMCQIAIENGEELPTVSEFYEYLDSNNLKEGKKEQGLLSKFIGLFNK